MSNDEIERLAADLGRHLIARGWRVATAESCTGGLVAGAVTAIAGSSDWFDRGFVTYSNDAKVESLGVPPATIAAHGAVSEQTAIAMADGALAHSVATIAVGVTGVAGPGGGTPTKPVGMVCIAWSHRDRDTVVATHQLPGDRAEVRHAAVAIALRGLIDRVEKG